MTDSKAPKGNIDSMEAIYALNIGDFLAEDFISDDLLSKISDRLASNPEKLCRQLEEIIQIYSVDKTLGILGFELDESFIIYDSIASTLAKMFEVDACHLFQASHSDSGETYLGLTGTSQDIPSQDRWKIGLELKASHPLTEACLDDELLSVPDVAKLDGWASIPNLEHQEVQAFIAAPMTQAGQARGLILFESYQKRAFTPELIELAASTAQVFLTSLGLQQLVGRAQYEVNQFESAKQAGLDGELSNLAAKLKSLRAEITENIADLGQHQQTFVEHLGAAVDARNQYTKGHSAHVARCAQQIAKAMALNEKTIDLVYYAGLLGSIGKMETPQQILNKRAKLEQEDWDALRNHPNVGVSLLVQINFLSEVVPYVNYQMERWDGSGSPNGLTGRNIPLGSRILAVADAYQAMTAQRPYRDEPMPHTKAIEVLQGESDPKWDPLVVETLAKIPADSLI